MPLREGGKTYHQFNVKIENYAERHNLSEHLPMTVINQYMEVHGRGLSVSLNGYARRKFVALKFSYVSILGSVCNPLARGIISRRFHPVWHAKNPADLVPSLVN